MAIWCCPTCGHERDARCKPKKCPDCDKAVEFTKKGEEAPAAAACASTTKPAKPAPAAKAAKAAKPAAPAKTAKKK